MAAMLRDSVAVVVRTRPQAIPHAMITMRKSIHGLLFLSYMGMGLHLAGLRLSSKPEPTICSRDKGQRIP